MKVVTLVQEVKFGKDKMIRTRVWIDEIKSDIAVAGLWENREAFANVGAYHYNEIMTMNGMLIDIWAQFCRDFGPICDQVEFIGACAKIIHREMSHAQSAIAMGGGVPVVNNKEIK